MKSYTHKQLEELAQEYPGDTAEIKQFLKWCKNYSPKPKTSKESEALINEAARQWLDICLMQIEEKRREKLKKSKI